MVRSLTERRLRQGSARLKQLRADLVVLNEQLDHFEGEADDARLRSLVSETPIADKEHRDASRHRDAMVAQRDHLTIEIERLEVQQDQLLDKLSGPSA